MATAIETTFLPETAKHPERVRARHEHGTHTIRWQGASEKANHLRAAQELAQKSALWGEWVGAPRPNGNGWVFVCIPRWASQKFVASPDHNLEEGTVVR